MSFASHDILSADELGRQRHQTCFLMQQVTKQIELQLSALSSSVDTIVVSFHVFVRTHIEPEHRNVSRREESTAYPLTLSVRNKILDRLWRVVFQTRLQAIEHGLDVLMRQHRECHQSATDQPGTWVGDVRLRQAQLRNFAIDGLQKTYNKTYFMRLPNKQYYIVKCKVLCTCISCRTRNSCTGHSPVRSIGHARSCRRRVAACWKEQTWLSQKCQYLR